MYFKTNIPLYSDLTADLNEMVKKEFDWDPTTWKKDYARAQEKLKDAIKNLVYFPDCTLLWVLRCDASEKACGGTLPQQRRDQPDKPPIFEEVISFV